MKVLIVDDEALAADRLLRLCTRLEGLEIVGIANDGWMALSLIEEREPDVLLLDIAMPGLDGMGLARTLAGRARGPAIVFVTASGEFAVAAFELAATDYVLKPVSLQRLAQALQRVRESRPQSEASAGYLSEIWAPRGREMTRIGIGTLDMLEAERDYVRLHVKGQVYLVRATLQDLERRLDPNDFVRVHRSTIVARDRIASRRSDSSGAWSVLLSTGHSIKVGRSFRPSVRKLTESSA